MNKDVFKGLKVLDLGWAIAAPWMVKYLADFGATIVHVESKSHPDMIRAGPPYQEGKPGIDNSIYFANYHCNKYGLCLNMKKPKAKEILVKLTQWADVLVENFMPGVMKKWGFTYEDVKKLNPGIIMISQSQCGQEGPLSSVRGTGIQLTSFAGLCHLTGWEDRDPSILYGGYTDCPSARIALTVLIAAILKRKRTGEGLYIDLSQYEAGFQLLSPLLLDYRVNGRVAGREGNRHPQACPHGVFPCQGEDNWIAIAVFDDSQWEGLCKAMEDPHLGSNKRFSSPANRKEYEAEIDEKISRWTLELEAYEAMKKLQQFKVPSGVAQKCEDLYADPQLKHRGFHWEVDHPVIGKHMLESQSFTLSKTPPQLKMASACMGEHTEYVCREILGMPDDEFVQLLAQGVFE